MHVIQKTIRELITAEQAPVVAADDTAAAAIDLIARTGAGAVLVCDQERLIGIFTVRDVLDRVAAAGRNPQTTRMPEVMTAQPHSLHLDDCVTYAINAMAVYGITNIPVLDCEQRVAGLLGAHQIMGHISDLFAALEDPGTDSNQYELDGWIDIGGG